MALLRFGSRSGATASALAISLCVPFRALASESPPRDAPEPLSSSGVSVGVIVESPSGAGVDEVALRAAIATELGMSAAAPATADALVRVRIDPERGLTVTYRSAGGSELSRTVAAPSRSKELPEVTALLVGNLARDEARELLDDLGALRREREAAADGSSSQVAAPRASASRDALRDHAPTELDAVNLSLFHPLTLLSETERRRLAIELGLFYSHVGGLSGVALTPGGVSRVRGRASGLQLAGIGYVHGGPGAGARVAGAFGAGEGRFEGVSLAGAAVVQKGELAGAAVAGAAVVATDHVDGAQIAGAANVANASLHGAQLAGAANVTNGDVAGAQLSGAFNLAHELRGVQISIVNVGGDVAGLQLGIINVGRDVTGAQLGIVNVAREVDGVSLGIVPYSERGRTQLVSWFSTTQRFNVGVRFQSGALYAMPTFGFDPADTPAEIARGEMSYSPGFSLGFRIPMDRASLDFDTNYSNSSEGFDYDEHDLSLRYRALMSWQFTPMFGAFAGGGVRHHFRTDGPVVHQLDPELSLGIELL